MFQHHYEIIADACQCLADIAQLRKACAVAIVLHAGDDDSLTFAFYHVMLVEQQRPSHLFLFTDHGLVVGLFLFFRSFDIHAVVVVAQHRDNPVFGFQSTEHLHVFIQFLSPDVLQVARKDYQVGMLRIDTVYGLFQDPLLVAAVAAHMRIREMDDAIAVESRWKGRGTEGVVTHLQLLESNGRAVDDSSPDGKYQ